MLRIVLRGAPAALMALALIAVGPGVIAAQGAATVEVASHPELGDILVGPDGRTLYTFDQDEPGVSNCAGECAANWPPLTVDAGADVTAAAGVQGELGTIERDDGTTQVTLDGQPLYFFAGDQAPGDANGDGLQGVWHVVSVQAATQATPTPTGTAEPGTQAPAPADTGNAGLMDGRSTSALLVIGLLALAGSVVVAGRMVTSRR